MGCASFQGNVFKNNSNFSTDEAQQIEKTKIVMDESKDSQKVGPIRLAT
jgi:hypothetical protein